jgi:hypothetical protein
MLVRLVQSGKMQEIDSTELKKRSIQFLRGIAGRLGICPGATRMRVKVRRVATQFASRLALVVFAASAAERVWSCTNLGAALTDVLVYTALFYGLGLVCGDLARRLVEEDAEREFETWKAAAEQTM